MAGILQGVFINPALVEPFGLTLIEVCFHSIPPFSFFHHKIKILIQFLLIIIQAAAHGLPMVATKNGGPVDIHRVNIISLIFDLNIYFGTWLDV